MTIPWSKLNRSWVMYAGLILFIAASPNHKKLIANAKAESLSRLTPAIDYFAAFMDKAQDFDIKKAEDCVSYHRRVVDIIPSHRADAYAMIGFCYERQGETIKAIDSYKRSLKFNPSFFWTYYDLGAIYYNQKNYDKARFYLERATEQDPVRASMIPMYSKVYKDVLVSEAAKKFDVGKSLSEGYRRAFLLLVRCAQETHDYPLMLATALKASERGDAKDNIFFYYAGAAAYEFGSFDKAVVLLQKFLETSPNSPEGVHYLGLALKAMGQEKAGQEILAKADVLAAQYGASLPNLSHALVQFF